MHHKTLSLILASLFLISLNACGGQQSASDSVPNATTSSPSEGRLTPNQQACIIEIDISDVLYTTVNLKDTLNEKAVDGLSFEVKSKDETAITLSSVQENGTVHIFSTGVTGTFAVEVKAFIKGVEALAYDLTINIVDNTPLPVKIKDFDPLELNAPAFSNGKTSISLNIDLAEYIDASDYVGYRLSGDTTTEMTVLNKTATLKITEFGQKNLKIEAIVNNESVLELPLSLNVNKRIDNQIYNGDFELDHDGWNLSSWDKLSYAIYDSPFDIWGNPNNAHGKYLYGYQNEDGMVDFESSLFKIGGTRLITFQMAGNCTDKLQFRLMKFNEGGAPTEIAKFNNWYYGKYAQSGFIFRQYAYRVPEEYLGAECYFEVYDQMANSDGEFAFICLDDIVTYYEKDIALDLYYDAGYMVDPNTSAELDMSDTSGLPFTELSQVGNQLPNGDFESGFDHWFMTSEDKLAYTIYDSKTDIWSNPVNATKHYLYGYQKESYTTTFHSDLFKVGGTRYITMKIAGNNTSDLRVRLMNYNNGSPVEIAKFNNWYFDKGNRGVSGFIFFDYYYQIDAAYQDAYCFFQIEDERVADFGFICLDDIVTYYEETPDLTGKMMASFEDPAQ